MPVRHTKFAVLTISDWLSLHYRRTAMCRFKFAVLRVGGLFNLRYRRSAHFNFSLKFYIEVRCLKRRGLFV